MPVEIERKFLVTDGSWRRSVTRSIPMRQGYLGGERASVRVRISGDEANLNIKRRVMGRRRLEYEYPIPLDDAQEMLAELAVDALVEKTRHLVEHEGMIWEVDEFHGANQGLIVAEIELGHEDQSFARPGWLGMEVTDQERYYNVRLSKHPYREWS